MKAESHERIVYLSFVNYLNKHYVRQIDVTFKNFFTKAITLSKGRRKKLSDKCILNIVKGTGIPPTCDTDVSPTSGKLTSPRGYGVLAVAWKVLLMFRVIQLSGHLPSRRNLRTDFNSFSFVSYSFQCWGKSLLCNALLYVKALGNSSYLRMFMPVRTARHLDLIVSGPRQYFAIRFTYRSFGAQGVEARRWISWKWNVFERAEYRGADDVYWNELLYDCWQSDVKPAPFAGYWFRISCEMRRWSTARLSTVIDIKLTFYDPHFSLMSPDFGSTTKNLNQLRPNFVSVNCSP